LVLRRKSGLEKYHIKPVLSMGYLRGKRHFIRPAQSLIFVPHSTIGIPQPTPTRLPGPFQLMITSLAIALSVSKRQFRP
jgi:hypothetical protein